MLTKIKVKGMNCEHCVKRVTKALKSLAGLKDVKVDLQSGGAVFEKPDKVSMDEVIKTIHEAGYGIEKA